MRYNTSTMTPDEFQRIRTDVLRLTQEALAEELGVHRVTLAKWEIGTHAIPAPVAKLLELLVAAKKKRKRQR